MIITFYYRITAEEELILVYSKSPYRDCAHIMVSTFITTETKLQTQITLSTWATTKFIRGGYRNYGLLISQPNLT